MDDTLPEGIRSEPDTSVTSATRAPTHPQFAAADRRFGWFVVNRWTYRPARLLMGLMLPKVDTSGVTVTEEQVAGHGLQVVRPDRVTGNGAVLLVHGGGYVLGSPASALGTAVDLARMAGVPVYCPGYRLGPEHPFPAALDDLQAAWTWLQDGADRFGVDPEKVVVGGQSAGGGLAAALVQRLHDAGGTQPSGQLLVYPMLDDRTATREELDQPRHRVWNNVSNRFGWTSYLGHEPGRPVLQHAVPARRDDLSGLPPTWIGVGTPDLFLDEDRAYASRLLDAGVGVDYVEVDGGIHGFDSEPDAPLTRAFRAAQAAFVERHTR